MTLLIKVKDTDNVIGLKEDIAMRLEGVADIERIDVLVQCKDCKHYVYHEYYSMHLCENCNSPFHTSEFSTATKPNDFCSYGERKEK